MERIKFAIEQARDAAMQRRLGQSPTAIGVAPASAPWAAALKPEASTESEPLAADESAKRQRLPAVLLLAAGLLVAGWAMWSAQQSAPVPATSRATAASQTEIAVPSPIAQAIPTAPADTHTLAAAPAASPVQAVVTAPESAKASVVPLNDQVKSAVESWRQDWAAHNMMAYLDHYGEAFTPADGVSRRDWIASRYRNVGGRTSIEVQIKDLQVLPLEDDRVRVRFLQDYASGNYRETAQRKTLELVRGPDDRWRIVGEWQGEAPAHAVADKS